MEQLNSNVQGSEFNAIGAGRVDLFPKISDHVDIVPLGTTSVTYTIPADARFLIFSPIQGYNFAVRRDEDAVYPAAAVTDGTGSFLNPAQLDVQGVTSLGIISNGNSFLSIEAFA